MRNYSTKISLVRNGRGVYCIDTTMGCASGLEENERGCYGDCYAARTAKRYGYNFNTTVLRDFESRQHKQEILNQINKVKMPFIRIGASGDPSENCEHTVKIIKAISKSNIEIVIITRHWKELTDEQLEYFSRLNMCINTSVSALDSPELLAKCLSQYHRIKKHCKSILRIVSCDFNLKNEAGFRLAKLQAELFKNESTLDTVFRPSKRNQFIIDGVINVKDEIFNGRKCLASKRNKKTYMGKCSTCIEMCGVNIKSKNIYPNKPGIVHQLKLFKNKPAHALH